MINKPTVFILGAGAHCSYGFSNGVTLKDKVVNSVKTSLVNSEMSFLLLPNYNKSILIDEVQPKICSAFAMALENAGQLSIDDFLYSNRHKAGYNIIGKAAIAQVLIEEEKYHKNDPNDDWLNYTFSIMIDGLSSPEEFIKMNKLSFITFNYDRFLETWLLNKIIHSYGSTIEKALQVLNKIPIYHIYGMIGKFPLEDDLITYPWIKASFEINTIYDLQEKHSTVIDNAKSLLEHAKIICFLGFGFHYQNISLLNLPYYIKDTKNNDGIIASSRFNITDTEWARLIRPFDLDVFMKPSKEYKCLETLKNVPVF